MTHSPGGNLLRYCTADQIHALLDWQTLAAALTAAFMHPPAVPTRHAHTLRPPGTDPDANGDAASDMLLLMPAWNTRHIGIKLVTVIPDAPRHGGHTVDASYLLLDRATGAPCLLLDGEALTVRRTAATSALAARALARPDPGTLLVVGTGRLAPWMARAHCALQPTIRQVLVWGRNPARAAATAAEIAGQLQVELQAEYGGMRHHGPVVEPVDGLESACRRAHIITCATTASAPVIRGAWLEPGVHLDLVGAFTPDMREVDDLAVQRAQVFVDDYPAALREAGDLVQPLASGAIDRDHLRADLGELLRGTRPGRRTPDEITLFKSVGHALEDLAAAALIFERLAISNPM